MIDGIYKVLVRMGYTDPLHAPITHMPIGLIFGALIFILIAIIFKKSRVELTARHAAILAFVMVFPTILFGVFDWLHFWNGALSDPIKIKMILAAVVLVVLAAAIVLGGEVKLKNLWVTILYAAAFLCTVGLGWFGSKLVPGTYQAAARINAAYVSAAPAPQPASQPAPQAGSQAQGQAKGQTPAPGSAMTAQAGNAQTGRTLFTNSCAACHADGGNAIIANLPVKGSKQVASLSVFSAFIRNPAMPDGSPGAMPAFQLTDAQASDLYAYIIAQGWK